MADPSPVVANTFDQITMRRSTRLNNWHSGERGRPAAEQTTMHDEEIVEVYPVRVLVANGAAVCAEGERLKRKKEKVD